MNGATVAPKHWAALAVLVTATVMMRGPAEQRQPRIPHAATGDLRWMRGLAAGVLHAVSREAAIVFARMRASAALAEYRARRREHEGRAEWCGLRREYPRPLRPIRISKACLDNPLAKDCI